MGTDIHVHVEVMINNKWHHYNNPSIDRNYKLFGKMGGVRLYDDITPIAPTRGLPDDLSEITKIDAGIWGADGHSHTFLMDNEIHELKNWYTQIFRPETSENPFFNQIFGYWLGHGFELDNETPEVTNFRFVFWFDN